jgi:hypothetical protein
MTLTFAVRKHKKKAGKEKASVWRSDEPLRTATRANDIPVAVRTHPAVGKVLADHFSANGLQTRSDDIDFCSAHAQSKQRKS